MLSDTCLPHPDGGFWCSIKVDENSNHLEGEDNWEFCNNFCPIFGKENVTIASKEVTSSGTSVTFQGKSEAWKGKFQNRVIPFVEKHTFSDTFSGIEILMMGHNKARRPRKDLFTSWKSPKKWLLKKVLKMRLAIFRGKKDLLKVGPQGPSHLGLSVSANILFGKSQ